jgi:O-acetyl-ADP-ribose deacetylase (regulator of RNase III)
MSIIVPTATSPSPSVAQNCEIDKSNKANPFIKNITLKCQQDIFDSVHLTSSKPNILQKHLSVLRTDTQYATDNNLPAGSATIVDLNGYKNKILDDNHEVDKITRSADNIKVGKYLKEKISFILQAATASSGQSDLNEYSLKNMSNSVYNCLYLANNNKVKKIAFPILGGRIFFRKLLLEQNITKNILYQALLKGAVDFLTDYSGDGLSIEKIIFCSNRKQTYENVTKEDDANSFYNNWMTRTSLNSEEKSKQNVTKKEVKNLISDGDYLIYSITTEMFNNEWKKMFESSGGGSTKDKIDKTELEAFLKKMIEVTNENDFFQKAFNQFPKFLKEYIPASKTNNFYDEIYPSSIYKGGDSIALFNTIIEYPPSGIFNIFKTDSETPLAIVNAANTEIFFGGGVSGLFKMAIGNIGKNLIDVQGVEIKKTFKAAVNAYIANPSAASSSTSTPPAKHAPKPEAPKIPFADVLNGLVDQLTQVSENDTKIQKLITSLPNFLYPPSESDAGKKKNLNCATPLIKDMIEAFETADGGDTNFYLGACRSIKAAYELVSKNESVTAESPEMMRATLLLNLRKNSLLLKVPRRWDYATMKMVEVPPPPTDFDELMKYSLQNTIEYYSQDGGSGNQEFKALKIAEEPTPAIVGGATISGVDGRFVKGIINHSGSCYFNSALQILLCDDDFIQLLITAICKPISEDEYTPKIRDKFISGCINNTSEETKLKSQAKVQQDAKDSYNIVTNFTEIFKTIIVSNPSFDKKYYDNIRDIVISDIVKTKQQDPQEVIQGFLGLFKCISNIYSNKIIDNLNFKKQVYTSNVDGIAREKLISEESILMINPYIEGKSNAEVDSMNITISQLIKDQKNINQHIELDESYYKQKGDTGLLTKYNNLSNIVIKSGILYLMYQICTLGESHQNYKPMVDLIKSYNFSGSHAVPEKSYNEISKVITSKYFPNITDDLNAIKQFIDKNKTTSTGLDITSISSICENVKKVYTFLDSEFKDMSISKTDKNVEHTDIIEINEYFIVSINRALPDQSKSSFSVNIESTLKIDIGEQSSPVENNYILQGYCVHLGNHAAGGSHWVFIKCNPKTGKEAILLNDDTISVYDSKDSDTYQKGASLFIYKRADESGQGGGGFKPAHNTTASKSKHNSSFKVSSSSKAKVKSRSHTRRVR